MAHCGKISYVHMLKPLPAFVFILFILLVGLLGSGYLATISHILNSNPFETLTFSKGPLTSEPVSFNLNLTNPEDNSLVFNSEILIQGSTSPGATVIASFETEDLTTESSSNGNFEITAFLDEGVNHLTVTSFDDVGNSKSETRTVYYSKEKI